MSLLSFIWLHINNRIYNSHYHKSNSEFQRNRPLAKEFSRSGNDDVCNDCCNADYDLKYSGKQIPFFRLLRINFGNLFALQIGIYLFNQCFNNILFNKLYSIKNHRFEISCYWNNYIMIFVNINNISSITNCSNYITTSMR